MKAGSVVSSLSVNPDKTNNLLSSFQCEFKSFNQMEELPSKVVECHSLKPSHRVNVHLPRTRRGKADGPS